MYYTLRERVRDVAETCKYDGQMTAEEFMNRYIDMHGNNLFSMRRFGEIISHLESEGADVDVERRGMKKVLKTVDFSYRSTSEFMWDGSWLYAMGDLRDNVIKIGKSVSPLKRASNSTFCPYRPNIIGLCRGDVPLEERIHDHLSDYNKRLEWFYLEDEVITLIKDGMTIPDKFYDKVAEWNDGYHHPENIKNNISTLISDDET